MRPDPDDIALAVSLVTDAGRLAARMRAEGLNGGPGLGTTQKTSVSDVVTAADHAAEELVVARLAEQRPDDGVLGEEGSARPGHRTWVIDPVDGTYNFVSGLDWWCSAIALTDGDELVLGAVHHPARDLTFVGGPDLPTTMGGRPLADLGAIRLAQASVASYLPPGLFTAAEGAAASRALGPAAAIRMLGSGSMDLTEVAQGHLGLYCGRRVPAWDRLPGEALVRGVGGTARVVTAAGVDWTVIGPQGVVDEVCAGFTDR